MARLESALASINEMKTANPFHGPVTGDRPVGLCGWGM
jgi:hypothetical protein